MKAAEWPPLAAMETEKLVASLKVSQEAEQQPLFAFCFLNERKKTPS